jgi:hypothetical protein
MSKKFATLAVRAIFVVFFTTLIRKHLFFGLNQQYFISPGVNFLYLEVVEHHCIQLYARKLTFTVTEFYKNVELLFHDFCAQLFGLKKVGKIWESRIVLNFL